MELDPNDPEAHRIMGAVKLFIEGDMETAIFHHEKAISICPSDTFHIARYAILLCYLGEPERGLSEISRAMRIDPFCSDLVFETQGLCFYLLNKHNDAIASFKKMQIGSRTSLFYQASSFEKLGEADNAKNHLNLALHESSMSIEKFVSTQLFQDEHTRSSLNSSLSSI
jgi:tetratricopeptide (TPR) repeat protein